MKEKKSCYNCKYTDDNARSCNNEKYLEARGLCKPTGRASAYCTWYEKRENNSDVQPNK